MSLPPVYVHGAIEAPMARVRSVLQSRCCTFRDRARPTLLELVRLAGVRVTNPVSAAWSNSTST
jgi:hypothetical protein